MNFCWVSASILSGTDSGFFQSKPNRSRMNCPISVVAVSLKHKAQARNSSIWRGDSRPVPPFRSNRTSASTPPSWNSLTQMRMVESSMNSASAIAAKDQPRSSSRMAFARRETRFSSSPSLAIATRSARSAALRKLRFVFTRRVESIPLIRSNDFRKNEESRYTCAYGSPEGFRVKRIPRKATVHCPSPLQREAAVDQMDLPGGEGALVGGEIDRERGHLLRLAEPAHRLAVDEGLAHDRDGLSARAAQRLDAPFERGALDRAGADGVAADPLADEVGRDRLGEPDHRRFRRAIDIAVGDAPHRG